MGTRADTVHRQVPLKVGKWRKPRMVDEGIVDVLRRLNEAGLATELSCQELRGRVWVMGTSSPEAWKKVVGAQPLLSRLEREGHLALQHGRFVMNVPVRLREEFAAAVAALRET